MSCEIGPDCPFDYMCNVDDMKTGKADTGFCQVRYGYLWFANDGVQSKQVKF